jgi:hypothetical protein
LKNGPLSNFYQFYLKASGRPKWKILCDVTTKLIPCDITTTNFPFWTPKTFRNPPLMDILRVVNFDSDGKSDQKIDIFSANQISAFLQQLTPPFRRFFRKKSDWEWRQLIFLRAGGEDMVKAVSLVTWAEAGSYWCEIEKWADVVLSASISSFIICWRYPRGAPKKIAKEQIFIAR